MPLRLLTTILLFTLAAAALAQDENPFQSIGKKGKILTLSKGKYDEFFDKSDVQQIGTALVNIRTMKVVKLLKDEKEAKRLLDNSSSSRFLSVDPLSKNYPWLTPYQFAGNTPIQAMDLDGKEIYFYTWDKDKQGTTALQKVGQVDVVEQKSDIVFLTDLFGIQATQKANLRDLGLEQTWIMYDNSWRLVPNDKLNQSLDKISKSEWNSFLTQDQIETTLKNIKGLGDKASLAVNLILFADGLKNIYKATRSIKVDELLEAGTKPDRNGLTKAGRALQKHGNREGSVFPKVKGTDLNKSGEEILKEILNSKNQVVKEAENGGKVIFDQTTGRGAAYTKDNLFNGFRELPLEKK